MCAGNSFSFFVKNKMKKKACEVMLDACVWPFDSKPCQRARLGFFYGHLDFWFFTPCWLNGRNFGLYLSNLMGYFTMTNQRLGGPAVFFILNPTQLVKMNKRRKESKENGCAVWLLTVGSSFLDENRNVVCPIIGISRLTPA
jgi:hypothetical protein